MENLQITEEKQYIQVTPNHADLVKSIQPEDELFTIILKQEWLNEECYENPEKMIKEPQFHVSRLEYLARTKVWDHNDRNLYEAFRKTITDHFNSGFNSEPATNKAIESIFDMFADCEKLRHYPKIFNREEFYWASYKWYDLHNEEEPFYWKDFTWLEKLWKTLLNKEVFLNEADFIEAMKEKYPEEYKEWYQSFCFPAAVYKHHVRYDQILPPVLQDVACRDIWTQFYFIKKPNQGLHYASGSSAGSQAREYQGYCAHAFAELATQGKQITTYIIELHGTLESSITKLNYLKTMDRDTTGNYRIDREQSREILSKYLV